MTKIETKAETDKKVPRTIPLMAFDLGNRFVKAGTPGNLISYPSFQKIRDQYQDVDPTKLPAKSWLIGGGAVEYIVGKLASDLQGIPSFKLDKWEIAPQLFYAAIVALGISGSAEVQELRVTTPDSQNRFQVSRLKALEKAHRFSANGEEVTLKVGKVRIFDEGVPAWHHAVQKGVWQFPSAINGVLDLGGGTAIARLINSQGTVLHW